MDFIHQCFSEANFLASAMMLLVLCYWALMIFGVVGMDMFDIDVDVDADLGLDADLDIDVHGDLATAGGADFDSGSSTTGAATGFLKAIFEFFYLTDVPVAIVASTFAFGFWASSLILNHLFNPQQTFPGSLIWLIPNVIVGLVVMRLTIRPMAKMLEKSGPEDVSRSEMVGVIGRVVTSEVNENFGQIEIKPAGELEAVFNARTALGQQLNKNEAAKIVSYDDETGTFLVELTQESYGQSTP